MIFKPGTKLIHKHNLELGVGVIVDVDGRFFDVFFPDALERMKLTADLQAIEPIIFKVGDPVRDSEGGVALIEEILNDEIAILSNGMSEKIDDLWPVIEQLSLMDKLVRGEFDEHDEVLNRLDGIRLLNARRQGALASILGGRVELFAHQLDTATRAIQDKHVRWLLADEVGLGKTIVAHMIISAMLRMQRIDSAVIIAPETLTVQWLGELYRKFHQVFVRIDEERVECAEVDFGEGTNPFEVYPLSVVSMELLTKRPGLFQQLLDAQPHFVAADEAHQLLNSPYAEVFLDLVAHTPHALLLTATPFQLGEDGFLRLIDALGLDHLQNEAGFHVVRNVSAVTREDIPQLPVRVPHPVEIEAPGDISAEDERIQWIVEHLKTLKENKQKALIFVNDAKSAIKLHETLTRALHTQLFVFHEQMNTADRDIELSRFRLSNSPALISSGAGSEGRNFQFCDVLIHFELPNDPMVLEQRIGRLDRIGRQGDIPIYYFAHAGANSAPVRAYAELGVFKDASVGSSPAMTLLADHLKTHDDGDLTEILAQVKDAMTQHGSKWLFLSSHDVDDAEEVMDQIPDELEMITERFCVDAAERVGVDVVEKDGIAAYFFEYGANAIVDNIPGVPDGARYLGTFDREEAITEPEFDFFASGHTLVEGLLDELEDSPLGRTGAARLSKEKVAEAFDLEALPAGDYIFLVRGQHTVGVPELYRVESDGVVQIQQEDADNMMLALEFSRKMRREERKEAKRALRAQSQWIEDFMAHDISMAVLILWS